MEFSICSSTRGGDTIEGNFQLSYGRLLILGPLLSSLLTRDPPFTATPLPLDFNRISIRYSYESSLDAFLRRLAITRTISVPPTLIATSSFTYSYWNIHESQRIDCIPPIIIINNNNISTHTDTSLETFRDDFNGYFHPDTTDICSNSVCSAIAEITTRTESDRWDGWC